MLFETLHHSTTGGHSSYEKISFSQRADKNHQSSRSSDLIFYWLNISSKPALFLEKIF